MKKYSILVRGVGNVHRAQIIANHFTTSDNLIYFRDHKGEVLAAYSVYTVMEIIVQTS